MQRPQPADYAEYYGLYVGQVPEGNILEVLAGEVRRTAELLADVPADQETYRYEAGKWSIREVLGHIIDTERLFGYRALSIARNDPAALPGMDQDVWAASSNADSRPLAALLSDLDRARQSSIALFESFDEAMWDRSGIASDCRFGVRAFPYIIAGHEIHHRKVLAERYL
ncbi:MAG: DinB family protein [Acidobacteriota bacterium]